MTTKIKERPILMHARSINGILAGRKTQTRRIVKPKISPGFDFVGLDNSDPPQLWAWRGEQGDGAEPWFPWPNCPYGQPGDRLYVREAMREVDGRLCWDADKKPVPLDRIPDDFLMRRKHVVSMFMPRWACRLVLEVVGVRVERVQDISGQDCHAEGVRAYGHGDHSPYGLPQRGNLRGQFKDLWNDTNGKGAWERNDWCWVVEFRKVTHA